MTGNNNNWDRSDYEESKKINDHKLDSKIIFYIFIENNRLST